MFLPDSIPDIVNSKALDLALKLKFDNIRILGFENVNRPSYHLYFYDDEFIDQRAFILNLNEEQKKIKNVTEVQPPNVSPQASKVLSDIKCWQLATVYTSYNYGGSSFTFSQMTITHGWYHKVVYNLQNPLACCAGSYSGGFNNAITSHYWADDYYSSQGRIARPICFHVFDRENRIQSGDNYKFENWYAYNTQFSPGVMVGSICHQLNECWDYSTVIPDMDDKVTSIDMFYRVFTPIFCH